MQLAPADIHGKHQFRPAGEQDLGEASGRGADIERDAPLGVEAEGVERGGELEAPARDEGRGVRVDDEARAGLDQRPRLQRRLAFHAHRAEADQVGGARAGDGQAPLHQNSVEPHFFVDGHMRFSYTLGLRGGFSRADDEPGADGTANYTAKRTARRALAEVS